MSEPWPKPPRNTFLTHWLVVEDGAPQALMQQASRYRELLDAEQSLHTELWQQPAWRRLHLHPEELRA